MTRVYEALKRAAERERATRQQPAQPATPVKPASPSATPPHAAGNGNGHLHSEAPEALLSHSSTYFKAEDELAAEATVPVTGNSAWSPTGAAATDGEGLPSMAAASSFVPAQDFPESAFTERTDVTTPAGSALSGESVSRAAGATVNAVGSTRPGYASFEVDPARVEPHLVALTQPRSPHAERYRSLRTRLLHASERKKLQAIVITSAGVMEGKTVTALNLSWLLAQTDGVRALLIDGDLRHPCAGEYLGIDVPVGLSEVLAGEAKLAETIVRLEPAGLYLLPGGQPRDDVTELLSGPKFNAVLEELRRTFNFIIIDAPPLGIFTDATVLIGRADGALVIVRAGQTRFSTLDRVLEPLPRERLLGVVLNAAEEAPDESEYYYQRRYNRRDGKPDDEGTAAETDQVVVEEEVRS